ncbi:MAG: hypothetical protein COA82_01920 [Alkaliphilus sp.]|nr:MAG: hypothetical protein COA82_01920 [Alkaliphilus sp.]
MEQLSDSHEIRDFGSLLIKDDSLETLSGIHPLPQGERMNAQVVIKKLEDTIFLSSNFHVHVFLHFCVFISI